MPKQTKGRELFAERHLAQRIAMEREKRGWSYAGLAQRTSDAGCAIAVSALWKIENPPEGKPRRITVDELVVLARVFEMPMAELVLDPEEVVPGHLADVAERAALALHRLYLLEAEMSEVVQEHTAAIQQLRAGLESRPDLADRVLDLFDARQAPEWVAGAEERSLADIVRKTIADATTTEGTERS